jgi:predicted NBD/HSP70 family sugar kinase/putative N-acetylmannosamine-6-phosphate epimerase
MSAILKQLEGKLVVSCQAALGDPLEDTETICRIARAVVKGGAAGLRINSPEHIAAIRRWVDVPIIGIQKRYSNGRLHITPDFASAAALASAGASIIALDCTDNVWPDGEPWQLLIKRIHQELKLPVMADIATLPEAFAAAAAGADCIGTTLNGYTEQTRHNRSFSWSLLAGIVAQIPVPVVAEGQISSPEEVRRALKAGAKFVVVGSAITRPGTITASFVRAVECQKHSSSAIGVDIGGTSIKAGLVKQDGEVSFTVRSPTEASKGRDAIAGNLARAIEQVLTAARDKGIHPVGLGVASAGAIHAQDGSVFAATDNLPGWAGFNLKGFVEERFHLPTWVINDAQAAVLSELSFGVGRDLSDFVAITIGTGIGGGVVCDGKLLRGQHGFAGSIGHHVIREGGRPCNCGRQGCLEAYVSTAALLREYQEQGGSLASNYALEDPALVMKINQLAVDGSPAAQRAFAALAGYLAEGVANIFNILDPQVVFISGGLIENQPQFVSHVEKKVTELLHFGQKRKPCVQLAKAGHLAGVQGAAALVLDGS